MKSKTRKRWRLINSMLGLALLGAVEQRAWAAGPQTRGPERIEHIVIIYLENRSFDNLYGHFPGANGLDDASKTATQTDSQGQVYATLPPVMSDRCACRKSNPHILVMQSAQDRMAEYAPNLLSFPKLTSPEWRPLDWHVRQSLLGRENSLFFEKNSLLWLQKFPVPLRREFFCKALNLLPE